MPANFSAVSENEMTYVMGGNAWDYLAPVMTSKEWGNFHKNLITVIGNKYVAGFLDNTVGAVFSGSYTPGDGLKGFWNGTDGVKTIYTANADSANGGNVALGVLNAGLRILGSAAAIYNLGFGTAKNEVNETKFSA